MENSTITGTVKIFIDSKFYRRGGMGNMEGASIVYGNLQNGDEVRIRYENFNCGGYMVHVKNLTTAETIHESRNQVRGYDDFETGMKFEEIYR